MNKEKCEICFSIDKGKLISCTNCKTQACKLCIPHDLGKRVCILCVKENMRQELVNENKEKCKKLEQEITDLRDKIQFYQLEIESASDLIVQKENNLKTSEISHLEKINNLEKAVEKTKKDFLPYSTIDNLEKALEDMKKNEKINKKKYDDLLGSVEEEQQVIINLLKLEKMLQTQINDIKSNSAESVPYTEIRDSFACHGCIKKIKSHFKEIIINGNKESQSIIKSVLELEKEIEEKENLTRTRSGLSSRVRNSEIQARSLTYRSTGPTKTERCLCVLM